jgi:hypothetical protein
MLSPALSQALKRLDEAKANLNGTKDSLEAVVDAARAVVTEGAGFSKHKSAPTSREKPSDFLQRVMWAEVRILPMGHAPHIR